MAGGRGGGGSVSRGFHLWDLPGVSSLDWLVSDGPGERDSDYYETALRRTLFGDKLVLDLISYGEVCFRCIQWCFQK